MDITTEGNSLEEVSINNNIIISKVGGIEVVMEEVIIVLA